MFRLALGFVAGYVLGSRAGRERYEQIKRLTAKTVDHPAVQGAAGFVRAKASTAVGTVVDTMLSRNRQPARPDMAYLDQEPVPLESDAPTTLRPMSA